MTAVQEAPSTLDTTALPRPRGPFECSAKVAAVMSVGCGLLFALLALSHHGSPDQDALMHYETALEAQRSLIALFDPWGRPFLTGFLVLPSFIGMTAARLACCALSAWTCYETWKLARIAAPQSAALAIPAFALQPYVYLLAHDTMTEPMFALLFAISLRLWLEKRLKLSLFIMGLTPLVRPEGFFLGVMWGVLTLLQPISWPRRLLLPLIMLCGTAFWWVGGLAADGDPLFIVHRWPGIWSRSNVYGSGKLYHYVIHWPLIVGPALLFPSLIGMFVVGIGRSRVLIATFAFFFLFHTIMWWQGAFGSIGFNRYFVCIAPLLAIFIAEGLRFSAYLLAAIRFRLPATVAGLLLLAGVWAGYFLEAQPRIQAYAGFDDALATFRAQGLLDRVPEHIPDGYPRVLLDQHQPTSRRVEHGRTPAALWGWLTSRPPGTRILWDTSTGSRWFHFTPDDISAAGYRTLGRRHYELRNIRPAWVEKPFKFRPETLEVVLFEKK